MGFDADLFFGKAAESAIAQWLRGRGHTVLPVYEKIIDEKKGPQVFLPDGELVAPDLLTWKEGRACWIEAKHKTAFSFHRMTGRWVTGIDLRHYQDYCRVAQLAPWPVWLMFLHKGGQAKDSPAKSPAGLFGQEIGLLQKAENHRSANWGRSGMVYWAVDSLRLLAPLEEVAPQ
jgi:hypothetical protein